MHAKTHALLARRLIRACGGLEEAADNCRLEKSRLAEFQDADSHAFMPADVMADLEAYAGEPVYSAAIAKDRPSAPQPRCAIHEGMETAEAATDVMRLIRLAFEGDGIIDAREDLQIEAQLLRLEEQISETRAAIVKSRGAAGGGVAS